MSSILSRNNDLFYKLKQIPMADIARRYVTALNLKQRGNRWVARCPFHDDRSPSFVLFPDGRWKCFGCQEHGDGVDLVAKALNLSIKDAAITLARDYGLLEDRRVVSTKERLEAKQRFEEARRIAEMERQVARDMDAAYLLIATLHRVIFRSLRTLEDHEELSFWVHRKPYLEYMIEELRSRDHARQLEALRTVRRWLG